MNGGGDVFATLAWGLRKYAWVVVMFIVGIGILVPVLQSRAAEVYEARAQVGPTQPLNLPNLDPLPRLGDTVFSNGAVADSVREGLGLPNSVSVVPERVQLVTAQDNIVFTVVGRGPTAESASELANLAAATFTIELNKYSRSVGEFTIQRSAQNPTKPVPTLRGGPLSIALGLAAGAIAGVGAVALLLVVRRPVVDPSSAEQATGVPLLGRVRLPRGGGEVDVLDVMGVALLCRRLLSSAPELILLASPSRGAFQLRQLGSALGVFLDRVRTATAAADEFPSSEEGSPSDQPREPGATGGKARSQPELVVLDEPSLEHWARRPDEALTLLVVPEGIGVRALRSAAAAYFTGGPAGLVIVTKDGRWRRIARRSSTPAAKPPGQNRRGEVPEEQIPEEQAPEEQAPEEQAPEEQAPEEQAPEEQTPEEQTPEEQTPRKQTPRKQTPRMSRQERTRRRVASGARR